MRAMYTSRIGFVYFLFHLAFAAPHIGPRDQSCEVGVTPLPTITYTVMAPTQTIIIDNLQESGCSWVSPASNTPSPGATTSYNGGDGFNQNIPTGTVNGQSSPAKASTSGPSQDSPPPNVISTGSAYKTFGVPNVRNSSVHIGLLALWALLVLVP